ncbi:MAG: LL-diaminopimelate aminotransferase [Gemmatimonadetes bacterium]|jgi:LL-diaminopimelate aminotransferase|nr:LL-diaminopimelate aminotransferase [Gemmatimonadota bacterium]MEE2862569.1 aminotransferase class I/II-fold pyridoxal phosphate-dependent enzyme [Gemmatimonadota bacterium]|tara:strand:+ start:12392 stop:13561 length:1170 start_codon:yes stop_codon:yes gene_type:complete
MPKASSRFGALPPFPLAEMKMMRSRIEARGVDVIDLGAGDAPLDPPLDVVNKVHEVIGDKSYSRYAFQSGSKTFREAISSFMKRRFSVDVDPVTEVLPLIGSKDGLAHLPFAYIGPGDAAVIPDPGYQAYLGSVTLAGGEPWLVPLSPENDFLIPLGDLPPEVVKRTRILYLNYPNNPTTAVAPDEYFEEAIEFCSRNDVVLAHDNAYSEFGFDGYRPPSVLEFQGAREIAIEFHSLSKTFNMTGWRLGWAVGNTEMIAALSKVKSFMDTGQFMALQTAGAAALEVAEDWVPGNIAVFEERRDRAAAALRLAGFDVALPKAAMYLWIPVPGTESSEGFATRALEEEGVIVLPGAALGRGGEGFFRIALTVDAGRLEQAAERLGRVIART